MACPGGCINGGGQPINALVGENRCARTDGLYSADSMMVIRKSNENPLMDMFYNSDMKDMVHELLHTPGRHH